MKTIWERRGEIENRMKEAKKVVGKIRAELVELQKECTHPSEHKEDVGDTHRKCNLCGAEWFCGGW